MKRGRAQAMPGACNAPLRLSVADAGMDIMVKCGDGQRRRRSIRLAAYDYGQAGAYFITLCTHERLCLFGAIVDGEMHLSEMGRIVNEEWAYIELLRPHILLEEYALMPNHLHAIIIIKDSGAPAAQPSSQTLGSIVRGFKAATSSRLRTATHIPDLVVWQRNYYEHIVRDDGDLQRIQTYIANNPIQWAEDEDNPARIAQGSTKTHPAPPGALHAPGGADDI